MYINFKILKSMKLVKLLPLFILGLLFTSCKNDDEVKQPQGELSVTLISSGNTSAEEGQDKMFEYQVVLRKSFDKEIQLTFGLENPDKNKNLIEIQNPVIIAKNTTTGTLKVKVVVKPDAENVLTEPEKLNIVLKSVEGISNEVKLNGTYSVTINPEEGFTPLTEAQKELLKSYKEQGIDLTKWIGKIPVEATVTTESNGSFSPFDKIQTLKYKGITYITLSENATKEKPLLKMSKNAFGLNEYLQWVFRHETLENTEYWNNDGPYAPPSPKAVLKALGSERVKKWENKEYSFDVSVDDILVMKDKTIKFVYENGTYNTYTNFLDPVNKREKNLSAVNFDYHFALWDELVKMAKGNSDLTEAITTGGSIHPNNYIGASTILTDDWDEGNWVAPKGSFNDETMTFEFNSDHTSSGGYDIIKVKFTSPNK